MKKQLLFVLSVITTMLVVYSCSNSSAAKLEPPLSKLMKNTEPLSEATMKANDLKELGFSSTLTIQNISRAQWLERYGVTYHSVAEIYKFMEEHNFIIAEANRYTDDVPSATVNQMKANYNKVKEVMEFWIVPDGRIFTFAEVEAFKNRDKEYAKTGTKGNTIYVIADISKFNTTGMRLEGRELKRPNPDPVAVMKTADGDFIELARW